MKIEDRADRFPSVGHHEQLRLSAVPRWLNEWVFHPKKEHDGFVVDIDPDFQRVHVWTEQQQRAYIEYLLLGGRVNSGILFSCVGENPRNARLWSLTDGKQRLMAVRRFTSDDLRVFADSKRWEGYRYSEIEDMHLVQPMFSIDVVEVPTREAQLRLYLALNRGGTPHSLDELSRVEAMIHASK